MSEPPDKRDLLAQLATVARALGHEYRLELLELVAQGERSVDALTRLTDLPVATVSQHLQQLRRGGLVTARREGKYVFYSLADDRVLSLLGALRDAAEHNVAELRQLLAEYYRPEPDLEAITGDELSERLRADEVALLDVRPAEEYEAGHLPGALNVPVDELERRLEELPGDREVIAYCRGPYCALSLEAVRLLRMRGIAARRLGEGYPAWKLDNHPTESSA